MSIKTSSGIDGHFPSFVNSKGAVCFADYEKMSEKILHSPVACTGLSVRLGVTSVFTGPLNSPNKKLDENSCIHVFMYKIISVLDFISNRALLSEIYTQYIKKRNRYIFADNLSNFKDVHFKLAGYKD